METIGYKIQSSWQCQKCGFLNTLEYDIADDDTVICHICHEEYRPVLEDE